MQRVAQDWLVLQLTDRSGVALGVTTGLQFLPALVCSPWAGVVADRFPKRRVLSFTQIGMAVPSAVLGLLALTGAAQTWMVFILAFCFGVGTAFDAPARQSFVVEMVGQDDLANAVGLNSASFNAARLIGPSVAGLMIAALGGGVSATGWTIMLNAASYLAVFVSLQLLNPGRLTPAVVGRRGKGSVREGVSYARSRPDLIIILGTVFFIGTFGMNFQMTSALMATEVFHKGAGEYGVLGSVMAMGSLAGALLAAQRKRPRVRLVVGAALLFSLVEVTAGVMPTYLTYAIVLPLLGFSALTIITSANATMQLTVAPQMRGRMAALYLMIFMGGTPLGAPFIGWIGSTLGARWTLIGGGLLSLVGTLACVAWFVRRQGLTWLPTPGSNASAGAGSIVAIMRSGSADGPVEKGRAAVEVRSEAGRAKAVVEEEYAEQEAAPHSVVAS